MKPGATGGPFLYGNVAVEIRRRILRGVYAPGTRIPTQAELAREFGVSAITIRRALHDLTYEGLLFGHQGLGVFVTASRRIQRVLGGDPRRSIGDEIRRAGFEPSIKELAMVRSPAPPHVARILRLAAGAVVWQHEKMIAADGEPVSLHRLYLPARLGTALRAELSREFIFPALRTHGIEVERVDFQFRGAALGEDQTALFGLPMGFPLIIVQFTPVGRGGAPVLVGETICRADKFTFDVSVDRGGRGAVRTRAGGRSRPRGRRETR